MYLKPDFNLFIIYLLERGDHFKNIPLHPMVVSPRSSTL